MSRGIHINAFVLCFTFSGFPRPFFKLPKTHKGDLLEDAPIKKKKKGARDDAECRQMLMHIDLLKAQECRTAEQY